MAGGIKYMRTYGYASVSSKNQNLDRQIIDLRKYNVEIITDKIESKSKSEKAELELLQADSIPIKI